MEENREFPKKQLLSLQIDLSKFEEASEEEKAQAVVMRESTTFFKDGIRKLRKNPLAMASLVVLILIILLIVIAPKVVPYTYEGMITVNGTCFSTTHIPFTCSFTGFIRK